MKKRFDKYLTLVIAFLISLILISSSSLSIKLSDKSDINNFENDEGDTTIQIESLTGLDPNRNSKKPSTTPTVRSNNKIRDKDINRAFSLRSKLMYGYIAYSSCHPEGPCYFPLDDPGDITPLWGCNSPPFLAAGTWTTDERWLCTEYNSGSLWEIDIETFDIWHIGGGGTGCNGLAWDPVYNRLYGTSGTGLYEYDPETGEQEYIGVHGVSNTMIALAINWDGVCYAWDVLFSGNSHLFRVDLVTGEATEIADMGENLVYAQDGCFDWETGILYLAAYSSCGFLAYWDFDAQDLIHIGYFECCTEITATMIPSSGLVEHDVEVKSINYPESGYALPEIPMQLTVRNRGNQTETTDVKMQLDKFEAGPMILEEDFSGTFPPDGWTTDFWNQSFTNFAGGEAPEAVVNNYDQYNGSQYYDNFIMTPPIDATSWEKVTITFRFAANVYGNYGQYVSFYVKYRKNDTSPWKDVSPWDYPLGQSYEGAIYTINCYGSGSDMGDGFQVMFQYVGYYYYYNCFYLDDVGIKAYNNVEEYNETVEDIILEPGEVEIVDFSTWMPTDWENPDYEDIWQDYIVKARSLLNDDKPDNNYREKLIDLYYPWMHDIEITSIDSPCEDGPGKMYPVQATIKNVGQYAECCIPIIIEIGEQIVLDTLLYENSWDTVPPEGWYDEHKDFNPGYGWNKSNSYYSGGAIPEARLRYHEAVADHVFYSYAIDTSEYTACRFEFKSYINHYSGSGLYALEAGYSYDGENWYAAWHEEPSSSGNYEVSVNIQGGHETTYIGFWVMGNPYYFNYWYIDDVSVKELGYISEYSDLACQSGYLEPGESKTFEFDDWTPDYIQYETTGSKDYIVHAEIHMFGDKNPDNDIKSIDFTLDYWHDPALEKVTSPEGIVTWPADLCWDNGEPDGRNGLVGSMYQGYSNIVIDDFQCESDWTVLGGNFRFVWNGGYKEGNLEKVKVYFFEETGNCDPSIDEYAKLEVTEFTEYTTGNYYFSRPEIAVDVEFEEVELPAGNWWVSFQPEGVKDDIAYLLTSKSKGCEVMADLPNYGYPRWSSSTYAWGTEYDLSWKLTCYTCCGPPFNAYIQPGIESIEAVAINYGTFEELDLTCNGQIWEYISDPYGTKLYEDNIANIDFTEPLGGTVNLKYDDFNFEYEGRYGLYLEMPGQEGRDDYPKNNKIRWGIGVDATDPKSDHTLDPPYPDGMNGWYVDDVEVTLVAYDPVSNDVSSGIAEIKYKVNDGPVETLPGDYGYFLLTQEDEGKDVLVEYWAIDNVGNEEKQHNTFTIDMDQTDPDLDLTYEITGGNPIVGWTVLCTAKATDETSGMERVEFFLNYYFQDLVEGSGPTFQWEFIFNGDLNLVVTAEGYDIAGNMASDEIDPVTSTSFNQNSQQQMQSSQKPYFLHKSQQNIFNIPGAGFG